MWTGRTVSVAPPRYGRDARQPVGDVRRYRNADGAGGGRHELADGEGMGEADEEERAG